MPVTSPDPLSTPCGYASAGAKIRQAQLIGGCPTQPFVEPSGFPSSWLAVQTEARRARSAATPTSPPRLSPLLATTDPGSVSEHAVDSGGGKDGCHIAEKHVGLRSGRGKESKKLFAQQSVRGTAVPGALGREIIALDGAIKTTLAPYREGPAQEMGKDDLALEELISGGDIHMVARDQSGCRMLQQKLEADPNVASLIFGDVLEHFAELMMDPFGNYLCQKLMEMCNLCQLEQILDRVSADLVRVSLNLHGARAVQKLVDVVKVSPYVSRFFAALEGSISTLAKSSNGNHVVQRCLDSLPDSKVLIFSALTNDIMNVSSDRQGCRILQRCIDASEGEGRVSLIRAICNHTLTLVQDPFGNYVVQHLLSSNDLWVNNTVVAGILGHIGVLSKQKFSSNVVERCLQLCGEEEKNLMIRELCDVNPGDLLRDVYGNYVIQSALSVATEPHLSALMNLVRPVLPLLRSSGQGRIAQKLEKKYPRLRQGSTAPSGGRSRGRVHGAARNAQSSSVRGGKAPSSGESNVGRAIRIDEALPSSQMDLGGIFCDQGSGAKDASTVERGFFVTPRMGLHDSTEFRYMLP